MQMHTHTNSLILTHIQHTDTHTNAHTYKLTHMTTILYIYTQHTHKYRHIQICILIPHQFKIYLGSKFSDNTMIVHVSM